MKIQFLGVGGAFADLDQGQSNMVITSDKGNNLLFDCGTDCRHMLRKHLDLNNGNIHEKLKAVYISHVHADHAGGLEWIGFCTYFNPEASKLALIAEERIVEELWNYSLKGGMKNLTGKDVSLSDYFNVLELKCPDQSLRFDELTLKPVMTVHVAGMPNGTGKSSFGLMINSDSKKVFISSDTIFKKDMLESSWKEADVIFQDCDSGGITDAHASYDELKELPDEIKEKMWLYHYDQEKASDAKADGFAGWVHPGQSFSF